ncbi:glycosyltransferase [Phycicoccus duodecadis]|uniref:D-inositol 3-phosphate glycosyltransferase n=1 Tax=Phycicoccus duodecadis TaxID=173053 RepID=A0A2N3YJX2_9MICO|nr:glycosyltransferase [Phycicoccus duodecadis]PKW27088.1 glycosyltransferase involved in cell wall biosynthesis [Phycicoccus duodecadis]
MYRTPDGRTVAIAHDYLTQRGGAERVVLALARAFPGAPVHTTLFDPEGTYPEFGDLDVRASPLNRVPALRRNHRAALPFLPLAAATVRPEADIVVASTSGWAHGFAASGRVVAYCHAPARWVYQSENYLGGPLWRSGTGVALGLLRPALRGWDQRAARRPVAYLSNSRVVRERIAEAYGIPAEVLPAPHAMDPAAERAPVGPLADWADGGYLLVVSRLLPYKNVEAVVEAVRGTAHRLVVVGDGPGREALLARMPGNTRLVSGLTDAQVRWVYAHARLLVAPSLEDYGLTPLEAAAFGVPALTLGAGGYLDTVRDGVTGLYVDGPDPGVLRDGVERALAHGFDAAVVREHADRFSEDGFRARIRAVVDAVGTGPRT